MAATGTSQSLLNKDKRKRTKPKSTRSGMVQGTISRPIQIHVAGEVLEPGSYLLNQPTRLTTALQAASGITERGSTRRIEIRKVAKPSRIVDLFKFETTGDLKHDPYLFDNDVIFVPFKGRSVTINGPVKRSGEYELLAEESLQALIDLAGGFSTGVAKFKPIQIVRYSNERDERQVIEIGFDKITVNGYRPQNGDVIIIPHLFTIKNKLSTEVGSLPNDEFAVTAFEDRVFVTGAVRVPGAFPFQPQFKLNQYIALAGGGTRLAKRGVKLISLDGGITRTKVTDSTTIINPGDTIQVQEKAVSTEFWIGFLATVASVGLSAVAIFDTN